MILEEISRGARGAAPLACHALSMVPVADCDEPQPASSLMTAADGAGANERKLGFGRAAHGLFRWRCLRFRVAEGRAVDADGDAVVLQAIEQRVDQRLLVEQLVPV